MNALRIMVAGSALWAFMLLTFQVLTARGGGRPDFSRPAGRPAAGAWYNFTTGMLPWNKESAWLHLAEFGLGIVFHAGVLLTLASVFIMAATPTFGARLLALLWPLNALSLAAGIALLIRRVRSELLRAISVPDDYLAVSVTCGLMIVALPSRSLGKTCPALGVHQPTVDLLALGKTAARRVLLRRADKLRLPARSRRISTPRAATE